MLIRMEHANITVKSIDEAVRFLKLVFPEFEKRGERETETKRWLHFGTPDTYVALEEVFEEATSDRKTYNDPGTNHIGFVIEDLAALTEKTARAGFRTGNVLVEGEGPYRKRVYIFDGVGNEWEFVEYLTQDTEKRNVNE